MNQPPIAIASSSDHSPDARERVLLDFGEAGPPPRDWDVDGFAFGTHQPEPGERQKAAIAARNQRYAQTGRMTSPRFVIESDYLRVTCAGTYHPTLIAVVLIVDGKDVRSCSPEPGYGFLGYQLHREEIEFFVPPDAADYVFDVRDLRGKRAALEVRDLHRDGYLDRVRIVATNQHPPAGTELITSAASWLPNQFETTIDGDFLLLPVGPLAGTPLQAVTVEIDGVRKLVVDQPLAFGAIATVGYLATYDLTGYRGKKLKVLFHSYGGTEKVPFLVQREIPGRDTSDRAPAFHIHNRIGLLNDPNGLVYHDGDYHLFHQFNYNVSHLDWAHYVSRDLMHWEERPIGISHDALGSMHSGSAAVDLLNTSGWQDGDQPPVILAYTSSQGHGGESGDQIQTQCIAYSTDSGRTFTKYEGNPVLGQDQRFIGPEKNSQNARDPKVFWFSPTQGRDPTAKDGVWVMVLFKGEGHTIYTSPDLRNWEQHGSIQGFHECPELFPLAIDGDPERVKWIIYGAGGRYHIGSFDGTKFAPETVAQIPMFHDGHCYASQTFNNTEAGQGAQPRRIQVAWQGGRKGQISLPNELTLRTTPLGLRLCMLPVKEIKTLYQRSVSLDGLVLQPGQVNPLADLRGGLYDIELEADLSPGTKLLLDVRRQRLAVDCTVAGISLGQSMTVPGSTRLCLRVVVDHTSQDVYFGKHGLYYSPRMTAPTADKSLRIGVKDGSAVFDTCRIRELRSIWDKGSSLM
ncbi:MAG: glycoside hydrolase family 32 protein [Lentisphaerae bacterium]|jgi:fructan beta-fructosidase|nr:glycoside hydrolase family 32 protein [Lentisphaerota bacterium]MBT7056974.1 glycoside hydrolase family 32 protein [Lentisphaerota bacterium]MBT7842095.1 glycoside hydrolase family 32 protein [Lentisphaerota bacterium]